MKNIKNIDVLIALAISIVGIIITYYLRTKYLTGGNHWGLFGTPFERFLMKHGYKLVLFFSCPLAIPIFFKRTKFRWVLLLAAYPVYLFLSISLFKFLD